MGFLDRAIRRGLSNAIGNAVEQKVTEAIAPKAAESMNRQAAIMNQAAASVNSAAMNLAQATGVSVFCPNCGKQSTGAKFCTGCGTKLPECKLVNNVTGGAVFPQRLVDADIPQWCFGGRSELNETQNGTYCCTVSIFETTEQNVQLYKKVLFERGFCDENGGTSETAQLLTLTAEDGTFWNCRICVSSDENGCFCEISFSC